MPENLDELAHKSCAIKRKRGFNSAADLLKILFLYACSNISFRILAFAASVLGLYLYRSRWQVELLFKLFKQNFSITTIKAGSTNYAETEVLLWLIIWAMTERQAFLAEKYLIEKEYETEIYSIHEKCKVSFIEIKDILCMSWSSFIDFSNEKYTRYLKKKKRLRNNQNDEFHTAILLGLLA